MDGEGMQQSNKQQKQQSIQGWTLNLTWSDKKVKTKNLLGCFFPTCHALITWFELSRVKQYRNYLNGNKNYFKFAGGSSYRVFELPRVKLQ